MWVGLSDGLGFGPGRKGVLLFGCGGWVGGEDGVSNMRPTF